MTQMSSAWKVYSAIPKVRKGTFSEIRYAGATTIDTPKFADATSAVPSARSICPRTYAPSAVIFNFFIGYFPYKLLLRYFNTSGVIFQYISCEALDKGYYAIYNIIHNQ